ncbi:PH domain-containing protein [Candidatus Gracilibacteria bacterium]|nr:PH domain-containing protein [Candidatus Gracilibacteria bacterium]
MPETLKIQSQMRPGEQLLMMVHRHWVVFAFKIGYLLILFITTAIILMMKGGLITLFGTAIFWGGLSIYWMFFLTFILLSWINDELDLFLITDQRIIGIEQISALSRRVTECGLNRVQEVNAEVTGILQTILHYGHVHIHTASEHSDMIVSFAPNPVENGNRINTIINEYRSSHSSTKNSTF